MIIRVIHPTRHCQTPRSIKDFDTQALRRCAVCGKSGTIGYAGFDVATQGPCRELMNFVGKELKKSSDEKIQSLGAKFHDDILVGNFNFSAIAADVDRQPGLA